MPASQRISIVMSQHAERVSATNIRIQCGREGTVSVHVHGRVRIQHHLLLYYTQPHTLYTYVPLLAAQPVLQSKTTVLAVWGPVAGSLRRLAAEIAACHSDLAACHAGSPSSPNVLYCRAPLFGSS